MLAKGGPVMIPLLVCFVLSLAVIIDRCGFWWRRRDTASAERALRLAVHAKFDEAAEIAAASRAPLARVIAAGLGHRDAGAAHAMEVVAQEELGLARRYLPVLDDLGVRVDDGLRRARLHRRPWAVDHARLRRAVTVRDLVDLVAFLMPVTVPRRPRSGERVITVSTPPGDAIRGRAIFMRLRCFVCHAVPDDRMPTPSKPGPKSLDESPDPGRPPSATPPPR